MTELDQDSIAIYGKPLQGKYKHYCCEFDYLPIDEHCFEFKFCLCFEDSPEIQQYKDKIQLPDTCLHPNAIKEEHLTGEGSMEYVEWYDNHCPTCGERWTSND